MPGPSQVKDTSSTAHSERKKRPKRTTRTNLDTASVVDGVQTRSDSKPSLPKTPIKNKIHRRYEREQATLNTPHSRSSTANAITPDYVDKIAELRKSVGLELDGHVSVCSPGFVHSQFLSLASNETVQAFLTKARAVPLYDVEAQEWVKIDRSANDEKVLYPGIAAVIEAIAKDILGAKGRGKKLRNVVLRDRKRMDHLEAYPTADYTMPDIVIQAAGPSFQMPSKLDSSSSSIRDRVGYTNLASVVEVKLSFSAATASEQDMVNQLGVYARYVNIGHSRSTIFSDIWLDKYSFNSQIGTS